MLFLATKRQSPLPSPSAKMNWVVVEYQGRLLSYLDVEDPSTLQDTSRHRILRHFNLSRPRRTDDRND
jgi:hypothetical protein